MANWTPEYRREYMRRYMQRRREDMERSRPVPLGRHEGSALEEAIRRRGRELTEMMRTPICMWRDEWKK